MTALLCPWDPYICLMDTGAFFDAFPPVGKAEWLAAVEKSLKGKTTLDALVWQAEGGLAVSPWVHADDFAVAPAPMTEAPLDWEISETVAVEDDLPAAHALVHDALRFGAEGLALLFDPAINADRLARVLEGVHLDFVGLHLHDASPAPLPAAAALDLLGRVAAQNGLETQQLRGTVAFQPYMTSGMVDWRYAADLVDMASARFPGFRVLGARGNERDEDGVVQELADLLRIGNDYLTQLNERGISPAQTARQIHFTLAIGERYFLEMAKLRAFRQLWLNVLNAWEAPLQYPYISVVFKPQTYTDDLYTNMIRATTMAMSAVLGGADRLTVLPYDFGRENPAGYPPAFGRRIARNVQHLLKMEGHLTEALDPMAGSYYLEQLTNTITEQAWERFKQPEE
ncbi:MAG: methylmalonyl-CoA mutase family protein [Saprospiraceae bacterium]|nr:methylmalonyl-CoA mutase family protein [Saprospiraceae bacterium]